MVNFHKSFKDPEMASRTALILLWLDLMLRLQKLQTIFGQLIKKETTKRMCGNPGLHHFDSESRVRPSLSGYLDAERQSQPWPL